MIKLVMTELDFDRLTQNENGKAVQATRLVLVHGQAKTVSARTYCVSVPAIDTVMNRIALRQTQEQLALCQARLRALGGDNE